MGKLVLGSLLIVGLTLTSLGCGGGGSSAAATPEEAVNGFKDAVAKNDWEAATNYMTDESTDMMLGSMLLGAVLVAGDEDATKSLVALMEEHGVDMDEPEEPTGDMEEAMGRKALDGVKDKGACLAAVMTWLKDNIPQEQQEGSPFDAMKNATVGEAKIDGDKATVAMTVDGDTEDIVLVKKDGGWYIDFIATDAAADGSDIGDDDSDPPIDYDDSIPAIDDDDSDN